MDQFYLRKASQKGKETQLVNSKERKNMTNLLKIK